MSLKDLLPYVILVLIHIDMFWEEGIDFFFLVRTVFVSFQATPCSPFALKNKRLILCNLQAYSLSPPDPMLWFVAQSDDPLSESCFLLVEEGEQKVALLFLLEKGYQGQ